MEIPRGHAMSPLTLPDLLDFIFSYFKAEYAPIRSFFSTATADPRQPQRWQNMGHELRPLHFRPAHAQSQVDLQALDHFVRERNLDAGFIRGIVIRFAQYEIHERLEKKLYETNRVDLMVRKALKEKHLIDALWPSPPPRNAPQDFIQQGVKVRSWYGDMFAKYFRYLHAVDNFGLRSDVDAKIKSSGQLMLVPNVDHLTFGDVDPIIPIVAKGAGYSNAQAWRQRDSGASFGEPDHFELRFDIPPDLVDTHTHSVVRTTSCLKCGTKRDIRVVVSVDPTPGSLSASTASASQTRALNSAARRHSKAAQKYQPGYNLPGNENIRASAPMQAPIQSPTSSPTTEEKKKQCPRCTYLNHPDLVDCEMCGADLPASALITKPPSPRIKPRPKGPTHTYSASTPSTTSATNEVKRPDPPNRHSLSSTLFSIFPFQGQGQAPQQPSERSAAPKQVPHERAMKQQEPAKPKRKASARGLKVPTNNKPEYGHKSPSEDTNPKSDETTTTPPLINLDDDENHDQIPEMTMMPVTPLPTSSRPHPEGMPKSLLDEDFVPVSPSFDQHEEEDAGWGEMSREEAKGDDNDDEEDEDEGKKRNMVDLDVVTREEMGVWGERDE